MSCDPDVLVPDPVVAAEFGTTLMGLWRWDRDPRKAAMGWPPPIKPGRRKFRSRAALEAFKANLLQKALRERESAA